MSYVVQAALGGHAVPIDTGTMAALHVLDLVTDKDVAGGVVPGLERAVAKAKGIEFGSLLHELGADYSANAYSPHVREVLLQINPECAGRLPKRRVDRSSRHPPEHPAKSEKADKETKPAAEAKVKPAAEAEKPASKKKPAGSDATPAAPEAESPKKKPATPREHPAKLAASEETPRPAGAKKRPASEGLAKRKPR